VTKETNMLKVINTLEQIPRLLQSLEALVPYARSFEPFLRSVGPYVRSVDLDTFRGWLPGRRTVTPWPLMAGAFGAGMVVGASAALLASPKSGAELRSDIKTKVSALASQARSNNPFNGGKANGHGELENETKPAGSESRA
jgi:hypothetical protein